MNTFLLALNSQISQRPETANRMWSWTYATQVVAARALLADPQDVVPCLDWIEREMAWACEDLEDAGVTPIDLELPQPTSDNAFQLVAAILELVAGFEIVDIDDRTLVRACQDAALRAQLSLVALAEISPARATMVIAA